ncbi:MAG TPA: sugar phosphate isomerase/epimerase [Atribacteraceae bacterium]|nr:sugar phosphate isomerase/epimerase [Atribacteraceae bacterium]
MAKFGCNLQVWTSHLSDETITLFSKVKDLGFDGVEIPLAHAGRVDQPLIDRARRELDRLDLDCTTCGGLGRPDNLIDDDPEKRRRGMDMLRKYLDITAGLGAEFMVGPHYGTFGMADLGRARTGEEWNRAVTLLREIADYARDKKVRIGLECLNRYETYFLNVAEDGVKLVEEIGRDNIGVHLDTYHMNIDEKNFYDPIKTAGAHLFLLHCSENDRGIPGSGHVNWDEAFRALAEIDYHGWLVIESFFEPMEDIPVATSIWRPIAPSREAIMGEGVKFIREKAREYSL